MTTKKKLKTPESVASSLYVRFTASRSAQAAGELGTALQDAAIATELRKFHRLGKGCAMSTVFQFCALDTGLATVRKGAGNALRSPKLKIDSVANTPDRFNRANGSEVDTQLDAHVALIVVLDMRRRKRDVERRRDYVF